MVDQRKSKTPKGSKMKFAALIPFVIVLLAFVVLFLYLTQQRDNLIIYHGIRWYNQARVILLAVSALLLVVTFLLFVVVCVRERRRDTARAQAMADAEEEQRRRKEEREASEEVLSVSKKMDSMKIRALLLTNAAQKWNMLKPELMRVKKQLDTMDDHQETLSELLTSNGADGLSNTEEVLDRVEQYLCKNVRKVLNYMSVADEESPKDVQLVRQKLLVCEEDGEKHLHQVQEFLFALAEFLNRQGEDDNSIQMLELYKSTILSSIESSS